MTVVAPAERPKSFCNSYVIDRICSAFVSFHLCIICRLGVLSYGCVTLFPFFPSVLFIILYIFNQFGKIKETLIIREKGRDLTQSYDKSPYTNRNVKRAK